MKSFVKIAFSSLIFLLLTLPAFGQKLAANTIFEKSCSNCKFILLEAKKAYESNLTESCKNNQEMHSYAEKLIDKEKISTILQKAEEAYNTNNISKYNSHLNELQTISKNYLSKFEETTRKEAFLYIQIEALKDGKINYNVFIDSGVKYGKFRIYINMETKSPAHIKVDGLSYKNYMKSNSPNKKAKELKVWIFNDYYTLAYAMNRETKADTDFLQICEQYIDYKIDSDTIKSSIIGAENSIIYNLSLDYKNCQQLH